MRLTQVIVNAIRRGTRDKGGPRPRLGQVVLPRKEDALRDYPSAGLTPSRLAAILREADDGSLSSAMQLYEEMEEKDPHLYAIANTRRLALTGLPWRIISAAERDDVSDRALADDAASHAREVVAKIDTFDEVLQHLSLALGRNIAVAEIVWDIIHGAPRPVALIPVDFTRIVFDELDRPRILTAEQPRDGVALTVHKFIVHTPHRVTAGPHGGGHAQRGGLLRVTALAYLAKNLALKDWMIFAEIFGMPIRIARYEPGATPEEKRELLRMLESLGASAAGIFSRAVELQIVESNRQSTGAPYERLLDFLNREMSKAWLGQTLTTDIAGQSGSVAASRVHEQVRRDILIDDSRKEAQTVRRDLLGPITRLKFGPDAPVPRFVRELRSPEDTKTLADVLDVAVNRLGISIPPSWTRRALGIPEEEGERREARGMSDGVTNLLPHA